jgi:chorismate mutase
VGLLDALRERWQVQTDVATATNAAANVKNDRNATNIKHLRNGAYTKGTAPHIV